MILMFFVFRSLNFRIISEIFFKSSFSDCQIISSYFFHLIRYLNFSFFISFLKNLSITYCDLSSTIMKLEIRLIEFFLSKSFFFVYFKWITDMTEWIFMLIDNSNSYVRFFIFRKIRNEFNFLTVSELNSEIW